MSSNDVLTSIVKYDKIRWNGIVQRRRGLQQHLMLIRELSKSLSHSGSLVKALTSFDRKVAGKKKIGSPRELPSIVVEIAMRNPRTYAECASIISKLLPRLKGIPRKKFLVA